MLRALCPIIVLLDVDAEVYAASELNFDVDVVVLIESVDVVARRSGDGAVMFVDMGRKGEKSIPPLAFSSSNCARRSSKRSLTPDEGVTMVVSGVEKADPGRF